VGQHIQIIYRNLATVGLQVAGNYLNGCGFAGAVRAEQSHDLAGSHVKTDASQGLDRTVGFCQVGNFDHLFPPEVKQPASTSFLCRLAVVLGNKYPVCPETRRGRNNNMAIIQILTPDN
jgi:hypothetical protein